MPLLKWASVRSGRYEEGERFWKASGETIEWIIHITTDGLFTVADYTHRDNLFQRFSEACDFCEQLERKQLVKPLVWEPCRWKSGSYTLIFWDSGNWDALHLGRSLFSGYAKSREHAEQVCAEHAAGLISQ